MGAYSFPEVPQFARVVSDQGWASMQRLFGQDRGWDVPACFWHAPEGFDAPNGSVPSHHTIALSLPGGSTPVESLRPGASGLLRPDERSVSLQVAGAPDHYRAHGPLRFAHLYVTEAMLRRLGAELFGGPGDCPGLLPGAAPFTADAELHGMALAYLSRAADMVEPPGALEMDSRAALLGLWLVRRHSVLATRPPREAARGGLAPWQLRRVTGHMQAHLDRDVTLAELSVLVGLSPYHFCRAFAASTGRPPHRWLVERRIERAKELMAADPRLGLTEVALAVGYAGQSAFGTVFRRVTGTPPSAWRRERML